MSTASGFKFASGQREKDLSKQRDLLERMVQERDEKISSLHKAIEVQDGHVSKLHAKLETSDRRERQTEKRHEMQIESMTNDQNELKSQLKLLQEEVQRIKSDPVRHALSQKMANGMSTGSAASPKNNVAPKSAVQKLKAKVNGHKKQEKEVTLTDSAQGILLQGQLYQAMSSLSQLRNQTAVMKVHYDAVIESLHTDLTLLSDKKAQEEATLLNRIFALDQEKKVAEEALRDELKAKNSRIRKMEKEIKKLEKMNKAARGLGDGDDSDSDSDDDDDVTEMTPRGSQPKPLPEHKLTPKSRNPVSAVPGKDTGRDISSAASSTDSPISVLKVDDNYFRKSGNRPSSSQSTRSASDVNLLRVSVLESQRRAREMLKESRSRKGGVSSAE